MQVLRPDSVHLFRHLDELQSAGEWVMLDVAGEPQAEVRVVSAGWPVRVEGSRRRVCRCECEYRDGRRRAFDVPVG